MATKKNTFPELVEGIFFSKSPSMVLHRLASTKKKLRVLDGHKKPRSLSPSKGLFSKATDFLVLPLYHFFCNFAILFFQPNITPD